MKIRENERTFSFLSEKQYFFRLRRAEMKENKQNLTEELVFGVKNAPEGDEKVVRRKSFTF